MPTKIEWTNESWNPITGCTPCSPGCTHCYAERMARRLAGRHGYPEAPHHFDVTLRPERLEQPLRWRKPKMVFVCSMSDLFHKSVPPDYIYKVFGVMALSPQHSFQILTKRPQRMFDILSHYARAEVHRANLLGHDPMNVSMWPLPNAWLGVSVENQAAADERISWLLQTPAAVWFVSVEPCLSAVDLMPHLPCPHCGGGGVINHGYMRGYDCTCEGRSAIDWIICGGESGPGARPMHPDWARSLKDQCQAAGIPYFFKQHGAWLHGTQLVSATSGLGSSPPTYNWPDASTSYRVGKKRAGRLLDGQEHNEMPKGGGV